MQKKSLGVLCKLNKSLYGLNNDSRKFHFQVKPLLLKAGFKMMCGDEAFFYKNVDGKLVGDVTVHVDYFIIAGNNKFMMDIMKMVSEELKVSKVEHEKFDFTGINMERKADGSIHFSMEVYAKYVEKIPVFWKEDNSSILTDAEKTLYRKYVGKLL